ncbi:MAG: dephospho-CoA kinase [Anaeroplasmataceae bacterium]|nr:dephospho-CoA kinase [Anaeroplasmataceae bacterium]
MEKLIIGITGGIACGKSNVTYVLQSLGYEIIDADIISKQLTQKDKTIYNNIVKIFGKEYIEDNGELNREKLAELIFHNPKQRELLNSISHPAIIEEIKKRIETSKNEIIFLDIPLLFETNLMYLCNKIICVYLDRKLQIQRLIKRDGISYQYAEEKIDAQLSLEKKKELSDYVIDTCGNFEETKQKVIKLLNQIKELRKC